jgi:hypothetical protein
LHHDCSLDPSGLPGLLALVPDTSGRRWLENWDKGMIDLTFRTLLYSSEAIL